ncbi:hypothetical protein ACIQI7_00300 [Kitasatospora sp. NPDC092039]|uniref:hypothetical protein n=1 Tax=Kitasatospora sp. NPDC092039 TaxID=3364086 RepID=UPI00381C6FF9
MKATLPFTTPHHLDNEPETEALLARAPVLLATMGLCAPPPLMVICELLGVPYSEAEAIRRLTRRLFVTDITSDELRAAQGEMQDRLADLVRQKRARPDDGLISAMVAANDGGDHLTEPELPANLEAC